MPWPIFFGSRWGIALELVPPVGYLATGTSENLEPLLFKTDQNGKMEWSYPANLAFGRSVAGGISWNANNYAYIGADPEAGEARFTVFSTDGVSFPSQLPDFQWYSEGLVYIHDVIKTTAGKMAAVGGIATGAGDNQDIFLTVLDGSGNAEVNTYGSGDHEIGYGIAETADGGFIIAGARAFSTSPFEKRDAILYRIGADDQELWNRTYGENEHDETATAVAPLSDGGFIFAGATDQSGTSQDLWLVRTDAGGRVQ